MQSEGIVSDDAKGCPPRHWRPQFSNHAVAVWLDRPSAWTEMTDWDLFRSCTGSASSGERTRRCQFGHRYLDIAGYWMPRSGVWTRWSAAARLQRGSTSTARQRMGPPCAGCLRAPPCARRRMGLPCCTQTMSQYYPCWPPRAQGKAREAAHRRSWRGRAAPGLGGSPPPGTPPVLGCTSLPPLGRMPPSPPSVRGEGGASQALTRRGHAVATTVKVGKEIRNWERDRQARLVSRSNKSGH